MGVPFWGDGLLRARADVHEACVQDVYIHHEAFLATAWASRSLRRLSRPVLMLWRMPGGDFLDVEARAGLEDLEHFGQLGDRVGHIGDAQEAVGGFTGIRCAGCGGDWPRVVKIGYMDLDSCSDPGRRVPIR